MRLSKCLAAVVVLSLPIAAAGAATTRGTITTRTNGPVTFTRWDDGYRYAQISIKGDTAWVQVFHRTTGRMQVVKLPLDELKTWLEAVDVMLLGRPDVLHQ